MTDKLELKQRMADYYYMKMNSGTSVKGKYNHRRKWK